METKIFTDKGDDAPREGLEFVERRAVTALVYDPVQNMYLGLKWKDIGWETFVTGGVEEGQTPEEAARVEVLEETGYKNLKLVKTLPPYEAKFFHGPKGVNRHAFFTNFLFELQDHEQVERQEGEESKHGYVWLSSEDMTNFKLPEGQRFIFEQI